MCTHNQLKSLFITKTKQIIKKLDFDFINHVSVQYISQNTKCHIDFSNVL